MGAAMTIHFVEPDDVAASRINSLTNNRSELRQLKARQARRAGRLKQPPARDGDVPRSQRIAGCGEGGGASLAPLVERVDDPPFATLAMQLSYSCLLQVRSTQGAKSSYLFAQFA
jgi:hypothetical protein